MDGCKASMMQKQRHRRGVSLWFRNAKRMKETCSEADAEHPVHENLSTVRMAVNLSRAVCMHVYAHMQRQG